MATTEPSFRDRLKAMPGVLSVAEESRSSRGFDTDVPLVGPDAEEGNCFDIDSAMNCSPEYQRKLVLTERFAIYGGLSYYQVENPLTSCEGLGKVFHKGLWDEVGEYWSALGRDEYGEPNHEFTEVFRLFADRIQHHVMRSEHLDPLLSGMKECWNFSPGEATLPHLLTRLRESASGGDTTARDIAAHLAGTHSLADEFVTAVEEVVGDSDIERMLNAAWDDAWALGQIGEWLAIERDLHIRDYPQVVWIPDRESEETILNQALSEFGLGRLRYEANAWQGSRDGMNWLAGTRNARDAIDRLLAVNRDAGKVVPRSVFVMVARRIAEEDARTCTAEYEAWCEGETYLITAQVFDRETGEAVRDLGDTCCGGYIGTDNAEEELEATLLSFVEAALTQERADQQPQAEERRAA